MKKPMCIKSKKRNTAVQTALISPCIQSREGFFPLTSEGRNLCYFTFHTMETESLMTLCHWSCFRWIKDKLTADRKPRKVKLQIKNYDWKPQTVLSSFVNCVSISKTVSFLVFYSACPISHCLSLSVFLFLSSMFSVIWEHTASHHCRILRPHF